MPFAGGVDDSSFWCHSGATMNLTIKDVPAKLHRKLKTQADTNKRSVNWEVIDILEQATQSRPLNVEALLADVQKIRNRIKGPPLTEGLLRKAKNSGRP